jgi:hypothetical protein
MAESEQKPDQVTYNYTLEQVKMLYALQEKPAEMSDHEWAIVSDEGFRRYVASQIGVLYRPRKGK